jgi:hypothetical protein
VEDLLPRHQEIQVAKLPERHIPVDRCGEPRAFVGEGRNSVCVKQMQEFQALPSAHSALRADF